jgi:peptidoglycan-associated lipoprotein
MKQTRLVKPMMLGLLLSIAAFGCTRRKTGITPLPNGGRNGAAADLQTPGAAGALGTGSGVEGATSQGIPAGPGHPGWAKDPETLKADMVHFDYDSSVVRSSEKSKVSAVADYLKSNSAKALEVDGHCDERGTDEYNRSLGERRALALREELAKMGVAPERIDTTSFGRDRPIDTGHSDAAHARNRRGEFIVLTAP